MTTSPGTVLTSHWPSVTVPDCTLPEFLLARGSERGDRPAVVDGPTGRTRSHAELARDVRRCAAGLAAHGLSPGETFAILAPNVPEWLVAAYGAMAAGGVVTGVNPLYTPDEIAAQLRDCRARHLLTVPPMLPAARAAAERAGGGVQLVVLGERDGDAVAFADLLGHGDEPPPVRIRPDTDLALLPYSSGTTGLSKGVMLTHRALVANVLQMEVAVSPDGSDRWIAVAPFFHAVGFSVIANLALHSGGAVVTVPRFDPVDFVQTIERHRVTTAIVVPPIVLALAKHPAVDAADLSSLRRIGSGAAPLGAGLQQACAERIGCPVGQGYGMTEMVAGIALWDTSSPTVPGSVGRLLPGVRARVVDPDTGADLEPGQDGELWVQGPQLMSGYLGNPGATAATVDAEGWLHTGDIVRFDDAGNLHVLDRLKELIKVKGFQVPPAELEAILRAHPAVADAAVVPVPDERCGEVPKAFVVPAGGATVDAEQLIAHVAERVAAHKQVREVEFVDAIPTSPAGKTLRRMLLGRHRATPEPV
ncbi:MAG: AMP-binding protein [Pseudonocardia sp.]|nr:AMP-binding protein [Pseudonocardia sp.]